MSTWPPVTHQDVQDAVTQLKSMAVPRAVRRGSTNPNLFYAECASARQTFTTPDGSGLMTHPSVVFTPEAGFAGYKYWLLGTPYDGTDATIENPCLYRSQDGNTWSVPAGLTNPLAGDPGGGAHNSDTHLVLSEDGLTLNAIYRVSGLGNELLKLRSSTDGVTWTAAVTILTTVSATELVLSPAIFWDGVQYVMYYVDAVVGTAAVIKRRTALTLTGVWSSATTCTILTLPSGRLPWHLDACMVDFEIWILLTDNPSPSVGNTAADQYLLVSTDGTTFTMATSPILPRQQSLATTGIYRSAMVPVRVDGGFGFDLWYSCVSGASWGIARTTIRPRSVTAYDPIRGLYAGSIPISPYVAADLFQRSDAASLGTADSGQVWTAQAGTPGILSKKAYATTAANTKAVIDSGIVDGYFEINVTVFGSQAWLMFRGTDTNNYWRFGVASGGFFQLQKVVAGSGTSIYTLPNVFTTGRLGVRCSGNVITGFANGIQVAQANDSFNNTGTLIGYQTADVTTRFDNIWARSLVDNL